MKYLFFVLLLSATVARAQYTLALNLDKGNSYFLNINASIHFNGEINGQKMSISSTMTGITRFKVLQATSEGYELEASYDSLHLSMRTPMGLMEFSSGPNSNPDDLTAGTLNMMKNKHFNITLKKNGAISKITNPDTTGIASLLKHFPMADGIKKMFLMGHLKQSFNAKAMKENIEKITAIFPDKKVGLNDVWGTTIKPDSGTNSSIKTSYQLTEYAAGTATIKGESTSISSGNQKHTNGFPGTYEMNGKSSSTFKVDASTGWIREADIRSDLSGQIQMSNGSGATNGKGVPVQVIATAKITG
jgi:Family of unknown function (DUF6263)